MDEKEFMTRVECEEHRASQTEFDNKQCQEIVVLKAGHETLAVLMKVLIGVTVGGFTGLIATILAVVLRG